MALRAKLSAGYYGSQALAQHPKDKFSAESEGALPIATMSARQKARLAFGSAAILLLVSAVSAYVTIVHLLRNEGFVIHTLQVQAALGSVDSSIAKAGRL